MPTDTRSAVAEVIQKLSAEVPDDVPDAGDSASAAVDASEAPDAGARSEGAAPAGDESAVGEARSAGERTRDQQGRFAKAEKERKEAAAAAQVDPAAPAEPAKPIAPPPPELKPPQDWRAAAKEEFTKAPRTVQEEAIRLYGETRKTLDRAAALEKEIEPWKQAVAPYEHIFRQSGVPPVQAVGSLLRTFAALQTAPGPVRAQIVADIIRTYVGTDEASLTLVGKAIEGGSSAQPREQPASVGPDQVAELVRQQLASERATSARDAAVRAWQEFEPTVDLLNEEGVRTDLADLAGKWQRENPGQTPSKEVFHKLYDRACALNEKAAAIVKQRKEAAAAKAKQPSTSAAAASGLKNEPAGPSNGAGPAKDTREQVERLMKKARQARV